MRRALHCFAVMLIYENNTERRSVMQFQKGPLTVSELNEYLKMLLDSDRMAEVAVYDED